MSQFNLDDDLVLEYVAESREHLSTIESDLLAIEEDANAGSPIDEQRVNRVFRAAHSIKGGAGFFNLTRIKELAHRTESVLDLIRDGKMTPNSEIVNILLGAFDRLGAMIADYAESNDVDISEPVEALTRLAHAHLPPNQRDSAENAVFLHVPDTGRSLGVAAADLNKAYRQGRGIFAIEFDMMKDVHQRGRTPLDLLNQLNDCGDILATEFDFDSVGEDLNRGLRLDVLFATDREGAVLAEGLGLEAESVRRVEAWEPKPAAAVATIRPAVVPADITVELNEEWSIAPPRTPRSEPAAADHGETPVRSSVMSQLDTTVRLSVTLLDTLMTLAGELVLGRNQLNEAVLNGDMQGIRAGAHRVSLVTSELQEAVSMTRMQPVSGLFSKFPRLVRDLAGDLGKEVQLRLEGGDVELDKTILEGLSDPLTHMVRNSVDHGIEPRNVRLAAGKPAAGTVTLCAKHQAGQVVIEVHDDGKGLAGDRIAASAVAKGLIGAEQVAAMTDHKKQLLIFLPGLSTADRVSNVSGRGVGMDVVKTNLDKLGGKIEVESQVGRGSAFRIKLPLTLAIIPSLLVSDCGRRFAIPQISVGELIRVPADQIADRIDRAGDAEVVLLRDRLVPLVDLAEALGCERSARGGKALNIVLVDTGSFEYGLVVDELHDTVEIVVKPMGRHLQGLREYAGATILGDGQVAVILDVAGLAARAGLTQTAAASANTPVAATEGSLIELRSLLLFENAPGEHCAVPIELVSRVERVETSQIENLGGRRTMQYGSSILPVVTLHDVAAVGELDPEQQWAVVVFECAGRPTGLLVAEPLDMMETQLELDSITLRQTGVAGSAVLNGRTTLLLDIFELVAAVRRKWGEPEPAQSRVLQQSDSWQVGLEPSKPATVLVAEDSDFFRGQIRRLIEAVGYRVLAAEDGQSAWELLDSHADEISVVTTDVEMPRLDGIGLTRRIRSDARFTHLPVIALSTLAGSDEIARGLALGFSEYQIKLDQDQLIESIRRAVSGADMGQKPVLA